MRRPRKRFAQPPAPDAVRGPARDERTLIVTFKGPDVVRSAVASLSLGEAPAQPGARRLREYVARTPGAAMTSLFRSPGAERFYDTAGIEKARLEFVLPRDEDRNDAPRVAQHVSLPSAAEAVRLKQELERDSDVALVHAPAILYPAPTPRPFAWRLSAHQWGLSTCQFPRVWEAMDQGEHPTPIAVIDSGDDTKHRELEGCITRYVPPEEGNPSLSVHASAVAGVIAAIRGNRDEKGMAGCCSARVHLFNVWNEKDFNGKAFYRALEDILGGDTRVVNVSMTSRVEDDETRNELVRKLVVRDKVVVAAMGDFAREGNPPMYPAALDDVIAVGSTNRHDRRYPLSSRAGTDTGIWISAPGEDVWTVLGKRDFQPLTGTSFATPMVSAAVWLALRHTETLTLAQVKDLLARSVAPRRPGPNTSFEDIGHGRLDMVALKKALDDRPG
jgi:hypothetical protein